MKIATWNVERLQKHRINEVKSILLEIDADILVLTETGSALDLSAYYNHIKSKELPAFLDNVLYKTGENRTTIWTKFSFKNPISTFDEYTSVCTEIETPSGTLKLYGTIIGIFGGIGARFTIDLENHINDSNLFEKEENNCIIGDLNVFFSGYAYPSHKARSILNDKFNQLKMINLTENIHNSANHIILSEKFINAREITLKIWNEDKKLSDHTGICVTIKE